MPGKQHPPIETELTVGQVAARAGEAYGLLGALRQQQALTAPALDALEIRLATQSLRDGMAGQQQLVGSSGPLDRVPQQ